MEKNAIAVLESRGLQSRLSVRTHTPRSTISEIFNGKRRATIKQAALLEEEFVKRGVPLNRWDLLYGTRDGESLEAFLLRRDNPNSPQEKEGGVQ